MRTRLRMKAASIESGRGRTKVSAINPINAFHERLPSSLARRFARAFHTGWRCQMQALDGRTAMKRLGLIVVALALACCGHCQSNGAAVFQIG